ncbi:MAG: hypothetical protein M1820_001089 [Bogoriella megaspora]|nr:MAG: hypothetical protein M1820_001089 [Bogoriella megaspora]
MLLQIRDMTECDIPGAVVVIQDAFADDPYSKWVFNEGFSKERNRVSLTLRCRWGIRHALFQVACDQESSPPGRVIGVAMWLPPKLSTPSPSYYSWLAGNLASWDLWVRQGITNIIHGRSSLNLKRYYLWKEGQAKAQGELWSDPKGYYFCNIITVAPDAQGKGIGKALAAEVLAKADAEGRWAYLESSRDEPNVKIYEKMGFKLKREMSLTDEGDDITLYCMLRPPQVSNAVPG